MNPTDLKYTKDHEWLRVKGGSEAEVGITEFAQKQLGDVVYVEFPNVGMTLSEKEPFGSIESVKAVSELFAPVSGEVIAVNSELSDAPENINESPYEAWIIRVKMASADGTKGLLSAQEYEAFLKQEEAE